jgi:hypothetical protein
MPGWTAETETRLKELHAKGLSFRQIACMVGTTRNACIGKARRLGLPPRLTGETILRPKKRKGRKSFDSAMGSMVARLNGEARRKRQGPSLPPRTPLAQPPAPEHWLTFADLKPGNCRYPEGEGQAIKFCGGARRDESSYCEFHHQKTHQADTWFLRKMAFAIKSGVLIEP